MYAFGYRRHKTPPPPRPQLSQQQTNQLVDEIAGPGRPLDVLTFLRGIQLEYTGAEDSIASGDNFLNLWQY